MTLAHFVTHSICHQDIFLKKIKCISGTPWHKTLSIGRYHWILFASLTHIHPEASLPPLLWAARWTAQNMAPVMLFCKWNRKGDSNNQWFSICFPAPPFFFGPMHRGFSYRYTLGEYLPTVATFPLIWEEMTGITSGCAFMCWVW